MILTNDVSYEAGGLIVSLDGQIWPGVQVDGDAFGSASIAGSGAVTVDASSHAFASASIAGAGTVTVDASTGETTSASVAGSGAVTVDAIALAYASVGITGSGTCTATATTEAVATITITGLGQVSVSASGGTPVYPLSHEGALEVSTQESVLVAAGMSGGLTVTYNSSGLTVGVQE